MQLTCPLPPKNIWNKHTRNGKGYVRKTAVDESHDIKVSGGDIRLSSTVAADTSFAPLWRRQTPQGIPVCVQNSIMRAKKSYGTRCVETDEIQHLIDTGTFVSCGCCAPDLDEDTVPGFCQKKPSQGICLGRRVPCSETNERGLISTRYRFGPSQNHLPRSNFRKAAPISRPKYSETKYKAAGVPGTSRKKVVPTPRIRGFGGSVQTNYRAPPRLMNNPVFQKKAGPSESRPNVFRSSPKWNKGNVNGRIRYKNHVNRQSGGNQRWKPPKTKGGIERMYSMKPNVFMHSNKGKGTWVMNNSPPKAVKGKGKSSWRFKSKGKGRHPIVVVDSILICVAGQTMCVDPHADLEDLVYSCGPC